MEQIPYADILILALIAGFILLRLRSILGQKSDQDPTQFFKRDTAVPKTAPQQVVQIIPKPSKAEPQEIPDPYLTRLEEGDVRTALLEIKKRQPDFTATSFLQGAKMAYEMLFDAFAKNDRKTLEMLLETSVYQNFVQSLEREQQATEKKEITLVSVHPEHITAADLSGNRARLTVRFASEQVTLLKDATGAILEGNPSDIHHVNDAWVFERDLTTKNPNWKIIET